MGKNGLVAKIHRCLRGDQGGDIQIANQVVEGNCETVIFFPSDESDPRRESDPRLFHPDRLNVDGYLSAADVNLAVDIILFRHRNTELRSTEIENRIEEIQNELNELLEILSQSPIDGSVQNEIIEHANIIVNITKGDDVNRPAIKRMATVLNGVTDQLEKHEPAARQVKTILDILARLGFLN